MTLSLFLGRIKREVKITTPRRPGRPIKQGERHRWMAENGSPDYTTGLVTPIRKQRRRKKLIPRN